MTDIAGKKISEMDAAATLTGSEELELVQSGANVRSTTAAIAALAAVADGSITTAKLNASAKAPFAGAADTAVLAATAIAVAANGVNTAAVQDLAITEAKLSAALQALLAKIPPVLVMESIAPSVAYTRLVQTANNGLFALGGGAGKYGTFNWATQTWTEGTFTGATATSYTWAFYCANVNLIWAGTGAVVHTINPATKVATAITGTTGALLAAVYNPVAGKVYGFAGSVTTMKEFDPTLGTVLRTFTYATASSGFAAIGVHPLDGRLFVQASNTGSGCWVIEVPYVAFNAVSRSSGFDAGGATPVDGKDNLVVDPVNEVVVLPKASYAYYSVVDFSVAGAMAALSIAGRAVTIACYHSVKERVYLLGGTLRQMIMRLDPNEVNGFADAAAFVQPANSSHTLTNMLAGADGNLYALASDGALFRIAP